jgi:hypothetical protein
VAQGAAATIAAELRRDRVGDRTGSGALRMAGRFALATSDHDDARFNGRAQLSRR